MPLAPWMTAAVVAKARPLAGALTRADTRALNDTFAKPLPTPATEAM
jgi:hypothetical protein